MSNTESTTDTAAGTESTETPGASSADETTFDKSYVEKLRAEAAKYRNEAKANSDAAKKLALIEEAQKSSEQKLIDAKTAAEQDALAARAEALRWKVAAKHGISDEDADLFLTGTDEETLTRQAERLAERDGAPKTPRPDLSQGARNGGAATTGDLFAAAIQNQFTT